MSNIQGYSLCIRTSIYSSMIICSRVQNITSSITHTLKYHTFSPDWQHCKGIDRGTPSPYACRLPSRGITSKPAEKPLYLTSVRGANIEPWSSCIRTRCGTICLNDDVNFLIEHIGQLIRYRTQRDTSFSGDRACAIMSTKRKLDKLWWVVRIFHRTAKARRF